MLLGKHDIKKAMHKFFLITGATKGIGLAITQRLMAQGHKVIGVARQPDPSFPGLLYPLDLSDSEATAQGFKEINQNYRISGIVNNVGIAIPQPLSEIRLSDFNAVLDLNLHPALQAMQVFTPNMIEQNWGRIVNITSRAVLGAENRSSYGAAKAALANLTRTWALELAKTGITINAITPGPTETELFRLKHPKGSETEKQTLSSIPMGRIGKPDEIAAAIEFFLSDSAGFITGQTLYVDGGGSIGRRLD